MSKADGGDVAIGKTGLKFQYGADFGTVNAILVAENTFNKLKFGAGYANNFDGINLWANVLGYMDDGFQKLRAEIYADGHADALGWAVFPVVEYYADKKANPHADDNAVEVFLIAKVTYQLDACQAYFEFADLQGLLHFGKDSNQWDGANAANFKVGATGNLGGAGWDVGAQLILTSKVAFSIPVSFNFGW